MISSEDFIKLLTAKQYTRKDLQAVNDICRAYPMFNMAHLLKVRILDKLQMEMDRELKIAGIYAGDRKKFFAFVSPGERVEQVEQTETENDRGMPDLHFLDEEGHEEPELVIRNDVDKVVLTDRELLEIDPAEIGSEGEVHQDTDIPEGEDSEHEDLIDTNEERIQEVQEETGQEKEVEEQPDNLVDEERVNDEDQDELVEEQENEEDEKVLQEEENMSQVVEKQEAEMEEAVDDEVGPVPAIDVIDEDEDEAADNDQEIEPSAGEFNLIERFINQEPGPIRADSETTLKGDISLDSVREDDRLITDTLAKIYVKQGLHAKAIYAYEKLSLKFPEKSAYFAAQIEKIKNINN